MRRRGRVLPTGVQAEASQRSDYVEIRDAMVTDGHGKARTRSNLSQSHLTGSRRPFLPFRAFSSWVDVDEVLKRGRAAIAFHVGRRPLSVHLVVERGELLHPS